MAKYVIKNNVKCDLSGPILAADLNITVDKAVAPNQDPPNPVPGERLHLTITDSTTSPTALEIVNVTAIADNGPSWTLTCERAQEGTTAQDFTQGFVYLAATEAVMDSKTDDDDLAAVAKSGSKADVGLGNVDNTSDLSKPVSTAMQSALDLKANSADLGTAATQDSTAFATSTQGNLADSALQPTDFNNTVADIDSVTTDGLRDAIIAALPSPVEIVADGQHYHAIECTNSNGTRVNEFGLIEAVPDNTVRHDYDPVTREYRGVLVEEARTNVFRHSSVNDGTGWPPARSSLTGGFLAPDGTNTACYFEETTVAGTAYIYQHTTSVDGVYAVSCFVKQAELPDVEVGSFGNRATFDFASESMTATGGSPIDFGFEKHNDGWYRIWVTGSTTAGASNQVPVYLATRTLTTGNGVYIWGVQSELGDSPSSYIPTEAASVTRTADNLVIDGQPFQDLWRDDEGTIVAEVDSVKSTYVNAGVFSAQVDVYGDGWGLFANSTGNLFTSARRNGSGDGLQVFASALAVNLSTGVNRAVARFSEQEQVISALGSTVSSDETTVTNIGPFIELQIGRQSLVGTPADTYLNGHIRTLLYYPQRLSNAHLEALSVVGQAYPSERNYLRTTNVASITDSSGQAITPQFPSGAVIERGANAQGQYVRWADGTQICTNGNAAIGTDPAAFVGTPTSVDGAKLKVGRWFA